MKNKILCFFIVGTLLFTSFFSLLATGFKADIDENLVISNDNETIEIKLTQEEFSDIYNWCEGINDESIRKQVKQAFDETITSDYVLYIQELEKKLQNIKYDGAIAEPEDSKGFLPGLAIVRCKWERTSDSAAGRTIKFWIFGWGKHNLNFHTYDDHDNDGIWETHQSRYYEWFSVLIPLKYYDNYHSWSGYPGTAKVKVIYTLDDRSDTKIFYENSDATESKTLNKQNLFLNIIKRLFDSFPILEPFLNRLKKII